MQSEAEHPFVMEASFRSEFSGGFGQLIVLPNHSDTFVMLVLFMLLLQTFAGQLEYCFTLLCLCDAQSGWENLRVEWFKLYRAWAG